MVAICVLGNSMTFTVESETNQDDFLEMSLEDLMDITIVSAFRTDQKISKATVPITVITSEDIHYSGLTNIPEVLRFATDMDVLPSDRIYYAVGVQGLHDKISDRTLILINGRTADSPFYGGSEFFRYTAQKKQPPLEIIWT